MPPLRITSSSHCGLKLHRPSADKDSLAHNDVWSIVVAPDGGLWFGTYSGLCRYLPPD